MLILSYTKFRLKQFLDIFLTIGLLRLPILLLLFVFLIMSIFHYSENEKYSYYIVAVSLLTVFFIQNNRSDKTFLKTHSYRFQFNYIIDYCLITTPVFITFIYHFQLKSILYLLLGIVLLSYTDISFSSKTRNTKFQEWIPDFCFEWKAGIRKMYFPILVLIMIGLFASYFIFVVPIVVFIIGVLLLDFYRENEPYQILIASEKGTKEFLLHKIKTQIILFSIFIFPLFLMFIFFHYQYWYVAVAEYLLFISLFLYSITMKYAFYIPRAQAPGAFSFFGLLFGLFIPIFVPIIWGLSIYFYFKSIQRLNFYLDDYN